MPPAEWIIQAVGTLFAGLVSIIFHRMSKDVSRMTESVEQLNMKIAVVLERVDHHERRITRLETRGE